MRHLVIGQRQKAHNFSAFLCGVVYIPPISSKYAHDEPFIELEREILRYCNDSKRIILMGDFNARTGPKNDYIQPDRFLSQHCGLEQMADEG